MNDKVKELEIILGGPVERAGARVIPGSRLPSTAGVIYFSDDGRTRARPQFKALTKFADPPIATYGGISEGGCDIIPPGGPLFHSAIYHGDLSGWRKEVEVGAEGLHHLLAGIEDGVFTISDGRSFPLSECEVRFV